MIREISINRIKSIKELEMQCTNLNLLVGTNSSGKSTIIQSILLVSENLVEPCGINGRLLSLGEFEEIRCWNAKDKRLWVDIKTDNGEIEWEMYEQGDGMYMNIRPKEVAPGLIGKELNYKDENLAYLSCNRVGAKDVYEKNLIPESKVGINGEYALDYLRRNKDKQLNRELCKFDDSFTLGGQVNGWLDYIIGASIRTEDITGTDIMKATYRIANQKETRPKNVGSGVSYLISILVLCLSSQEGEIMLIENPEIHLHPMAQSRVCEFLYFIANHNRQLFIETHSDHLFNRIRVGAATNEMNMNKIQVNFISLDEEYCTQNTIVEFGKRGRILNPQKDLFDQFDIDLNKMLGM